MATSTVQPQVNKVRPSHKPAAVKAAIIAKRANGENTTKIAKDLGITRNTTRKIIKESNIDHLIESGEVGAANLIHKSLHVIEKRLDTNSEEAAKFILSNTVFSDRYSKQGQRMKADTILQVAINNLIAPAKTAQPSTKVIEASSNNSTKSEQD